MKKTILSFFILFGFLNLSICQEIGDMDYKKYDVVWGVGLFKSFLKDEYVGFDKIGGIATPVYSEEYKMGFSVHSRYMFKPIKTIGLGIHLGLGLDVNSFIEAPVVLFGGSISFGKHQSFILDIGWSDGKRRKVPQNLRDRLSDDVLTEIPILVERSELNTGFYIGLSYRIF